MVDINEDKVYEFYEYFYKKKYNSPKYRYKPSDKAKKMVSNFIAKLDKHYNLKTIGLNFLWNYFVYQFNYWRNAELDSFYGKFQITYVIGDKALKRFHENPYDNMWVTEGSEIIELYGLNKLELVPTDVENTYNSRYEVSIKKLKYNTDEGFYHCITSTTLYNHSHSCCFFCKYREDCKKILKDKYPKIYEKRGYN